MSDAASRHAYGIPGGARRTVYVATLLASWLAGTLAAPAGWWAVAPAAAAAYLMARGGMERGGWRRLRRWHGVPDLGGSWRCADGGGLRVRQGWTAMAIDLERGSGRWRSQTAAFVREDGGTVLVAVLAGPDRRILRWRPDAAVATLAGPEGAAELRLERA